ncbi:hypothetical protein ACIO1C_14535 [Streptomyces sp. NPDC087420]|uniref:hypothetical protein n=1 Tax=Streptomyces sp. NPDC087420 TaxID=3365785 RepID=UPI003838A1D2
MDDLTKRAALVSETLLLSHGHGGTPHRVGSSMWAPPGASNGAQGDGMGWRYSTTEYGIYCPDLDRLGGWILDAEDLLRAGPVWYMPECWTTSQYIRGTEQPDPHRAPLPTGVIDYLVRDGRAVDASGEQPLKSQVVRPVLRMDLPFVEGVDLKTFSRITVEEFDSYTAFRDFLRQSLLDMDESLNAVQSERELVKPGLHIKDQVRGMRAELLKARRKGAVAASGALIGSVGAVLVAVYGPRPCRPPSRLSARGAACGGWSTPCRRTRPAISAATSGTSCGSWTRAADATDSLDAQSGPAVRAPPRCGRASRRLRIHPAGAPSSSLALVTGFVRVAIPVVRGWFSQLLRYLAHGRKSVRSSGLSRPYRIALMPATEGHTPRSSSGGKRAGERYRTGPAQYTCWLRR